MPRLQIREAPAPIKGFPEGLAWGDWTLVYRSPKTGQLLRMLNNDAHRILTPELRERLAAEPNIFLVKTHERPARSYFPGEMAVRMIRRPGAALPSIRLSYEAAFEAHAANPKRNPGAGIDGWRAGVSAESLDLLWRLHGETAEAFGYTRAGSARLPESRPGERFGASAEHGLGVLADILRDGR